MALMWHLKHIDLCFQFSPRYLTLVESLPTYGVHYYEVKVGPLVWLIENDSCYALSHIICTFFWQDKQGIPWWLGISYKGIGQYDLQDKLKPRKVNRHSRLPVEMSVLFFLSHARIWVWWRQKARVRMAAVAKQCSDSPALSHASCLSVPWNLGLNCSRRLRTWSKVSF